VRVTAINNDITLLEVGEKSLDEVVNWLTSHDKQHHAAGFLELCTELLDGVGTLNRLSYIPTSFISNFSAWWKDWQLHTLSLVGEEVVDLCNGTVVGNDIETVISSVQDQVLTHNGQANQAEISSGFIISI
jgi:hypothetical protein